MDLGNYWSRYMGNDTESSTADYCYIQPDYDWYLYTYYSYPPPRSTKEQAFEILKVLVEEKIIKEPTSFKKFCDLIEKIAKVI